VRGDGGLGGYAGGIALKRKLLTLLDFGKITETRFFGFICYLTYAPATLRRRLKNLVSGGSPPPFSAFAKLQ